MLQKTHSYSPVYSHIVIFHSRAPELMCSSEVWCSTQNRSYKSLVWTKPWREIPRIVWSGISWRCIRAVFDAHMYKCCSRKLRCVRPDDWRTWRKNKKQNDDKSIKNDLQEVQLIPDMQGSAEMFTVEQDQADPQDHLCCSVTSDPW